MGMLNRLAVHIEYIERAIRCIDKADRTKPVVGRSNELFVFVCPCRGECNARGRQPFAMHEVSTDIADKSVAAKLGSIGVPSVDRDSCRRSEVPDGIFGRHDPRLFRRIKRDELPLAGIVYQEAVSLLLRTPLLPYDPPRFWRACPEHASTGPIASDVMNEPADGKLRIPREVALRINDVLNVVAVTTNESVPEVINGMGRTAGLR